VLAAELAFLEEHWPAVELASLRERHRERGGHR